MTREEIDYILQNYIIEKHRLFDLIQDPEANGLDPETVEHLQYQLDLICGILPAMIRLPSPYSMTLIDHRLEIALGLKSPKRQKKVLYPLQLALDALQAAMEVQPRDGRYYAAWQAWRELYESDKSGVTDYLLNHEIWLDPDPED